MATPTLEDNEYQCQTCKGIFKKGWTEEEALEELGNAWPDHTPDDCDLVCDNCWKAMGCDQSHQAENQ